MNVEKTLEQLETLLTQHRTNEIEGFLLEKIGESASQEDTGSLITLMNELIGYYRESGEFEKALGYCREVLQVAAQAGLAGTIPYATTLLNVANTCREGGLAREAMVYYQEVRGIYINNIEDTDFRYVNLYNGMGMLFQDMGDYESACDCQERALSVAVLYHEARVETAILYTSLAICQLKLMRYQEAIENLRRAFELFEQDEKKDYHYSSALSAMGEAQYLAGNMEESAYYYERALHEIEKTSGRNKAYEITLRNLNAVQKQLKDLPQRNIHFKNGLELCESFYKEYGIPMIRTKFPEYEGLIAAGLVGESSECFGFDDEVSRDHDFGPGFCLWLTDQVYDEIGEELQEEYNKLPDTYMGVTRIETHKARKSVGVFRIGEFYEQLIGLSDVPTTQNQWLFLEDYQLASATNGKVFRDDLGEFTRIRNGILRYYPEEVRIRKIAREAALMAQSGQYNYNRMFGRGEKVTADIALAEFLKHTMVMVYLLNRRYAPFYKWMHRGMREMKILTEIRDIMTALVELPNGDERIPDMIELIVAMIIKEMKKQGLTSGEDNYLDHHTDNILHSIPQKDRKEQEEGSFKAALVNEVLGLMWESYLQVQTKIQEQEEEQSREAFEVIGKSELLNWSPEMLKSLIHDFRIANSNGRNLIKEKDIRTLESIAPLQFADYMDLLPEITDVKREIAEEIVKVQMDWLETASFRYPKAARVMQGIITLEDNASVAPYEVQLRAELLTYSDETLDLYGAFIAQLCQEGKNLAEMTMYNMALLCGFSSLDEYEDSL